MVINELRASGAEAISIADGNREERLLATSEIRCVGPTVTVNGVRMATPITIRAIGPASTMYSSLNMRGGSAEFIQLLGASIDIRRSSHVEVRRFTGEFVPRYARVAGGEE